jgi:transketolase
MEATPAETELKQIASTLRAHALRMVHRANASHIGSCLSMADLMACLYWRCLRVDPAQPDWPERDRFILSKGHAAAMLYATLAERGFLPTTLLEQYCQEGCLLTGHANNAVPGVELSTGSLGHGLPVGCGLALAAKRDQLNYRTVVLASDGEMDEGSNWEAILFAPQHQLDNLLLIVDYNKIQSFGRVSEILELEPLADKFRAFRWSVRAIDGHNYAEIVDALSSFPFEPGRPSVLLAHTIKGKGVSFMEDRLLWHYRSPSAQQLAEALSELGVQA